MEASGLTYPNRFVRAYLLALQQVAGLDELLTAADLTARYGGDLPPDNMQAGMDFAEIAMLNMALEDIYGTRGGRGMALRVGMLLFEHGLQGVGVLRGVMTPQFKALPVPARAQISLMALASVFETHSDQHSTFEERDTVFHFVADPSPFAWERVSDQPVCHVMAGVLRACLHWATDGHAFVVQEIQCRATGADTCVFSVNKNPIGRI